MTAQTNDKTNANAGESNGPSTGAVAARKGTDLAGSGGRTVIADAVVAKIVGMATREVRGVYAMGAGISRAFGAVRERIGGSTSTVTQGVAVEVGERQAAIDLDVVVEYGVSIPDLAAGIRRNVVGAVEKLCGLEVTEVNITVGDIHLPGDQESNEAPEQPRVQ